MTGKFGKYTKEEMLAGAGWSARARRTKICANDFINYEKQKTRQQSADIEREHRDNIPLGWFIFAHKVGNSWS